MPEESIASEVLAASVGGAISASVLYPLEVLKTKMQALDSTATEEEDQDDSEAAANNNDVEDGEVVHATTRRVENKKNHLKAKKKAKGGQKGMISFALDLYAREGATVFFRGVETSAFQSALEKALYFFAYTALKEVHAVLTNGARLDTVTNLAMGCAAEWAHLPISLPVDAWTTKIQTSQDAPFKILLTMLSDKNQNFYKGISAYYLLCFKPALQYTVYEQVKAVMVKGRTKKTLSTAEAFILGMIARSVATILVFPFLRAKVIMQSQKDDDNNDNNTSNGSDNKNKSSSTMDILLKQYRLGCISSLFFGLGPELTRGVLSAGFALAIKERIPIIVQSLLLQSRNNNNQFHVRRR